MPALVRFSTASGNPDVHDGEREGRGIAVKFQLPGGAVTDLLCVTSPTFLARNPDDFLELMRARLPDPETGAPDMEKVGAYLGAHPEAMPAVQANLGAEPPASFAQLAYNSLHSFRLIGSGGEGRWVRYRWEPEAGEGGSPTTRQRRAPPISADRAGGADRRRPGRLSPHPRPRRGGRSDRRPDRALAGEPRAAAAGTLELTAIAEDPEADGSIVVFDPTNVVDGIELPEDPILFARSRAYTISASQRA